MQIDYHPHSAMDDDSLCVASKYWKRVMDAANKVRERFSADRIATSVPDAI